ncbi:hypothetical protein I316_04932 [Kwoniella heveanensis BCC8398]|uniref:Protein kinase domain-containing protein n=1 Tax=Kwoniella heveanensis BCC8398 TaxID=1296120 RepID=A0A1B9GR51_9TREE|nr:hypothetical protein I316_04932 [Kwoniella heveanensis BCC8398]
MTYVGRFPVTSDISGITQSEIRAVIAHEIQLYQNQLKPLQGTVVPRFVGLWGGGPGEVEEVWCAMYEDGGMLLPDWQRANLTYHPWHKDTFWETLSLTISPSDTVRALYHALHDAGVLHGDVCWRHVLRSGVKLKLVDFDQAAVRGPTDGDEIWAMSCAAEMEDVERMLRNGGKW